MNNHPPTVIWFRNDLRLIDNPALYHAMRDGKSIIPVFIYDRDTMDRDYGAAQKVWLHHALTSLQNKLKSYGLSLIIRQGDSQLILDDILRETGAKSVFWNRSYEGWSIERDKHIKLNLKTRDIDVQSFKANLLFEPWQVKNGSGDHYRVFTPFWKKCLQQAEMIDAALPPPQSLNMNIYQGEVESLPINDLKLLPLRDWNETIEFHWDMSEEGAWARMKSFFKLGLARYKEGRDCPSCDYTSRMSPYLRFGMISPRSIWHEANMYAVAHDVPQTDLVHFLSEVGWREFAFHLLYNHPDMKTNPLQKKYEHFPWQADKTYLHAWQTGQTGYPLIDAGMRQLWATGWMHNRVRMLVGSFLVKHLLQPWQDGEQWFWDTLVDACPANNTAGWQWIGGCGADAAPYFRVFNPITQGNKFNAYDYVREYVPEIATLPDKYLFSPWEAEGNILTSSNIELGVTYPHPIIGHKEGRQRALDAFQALKINS